MQFSLRVPLTVALSLLLFSLLACGEKPVIGPNVSKLEESQRCIDCHGGASKVTGKLISDEWRVSNHNINNGASCKDCHEPHQSHPDAGNCNRCHGGSPVAGPDVTVNPDAAGKCSKCHTKNGGFGSSTVNGAIIDGLRVHFNNITSPANTETSGLRRKGYPASYVSSQNVSKCRNCHNPHDTTTQMQQFREWSRSGKGDIYAKPWTQYDFKTRGTTTAGASPATSFGDDCVRCHTATGFVNYISSSFKTIAPWDTYGTVYPNVSPDKTKEPLGCRSCHDDGAGNVYAYKARTVGKVTAFYNYSVNSQVGTTINRIRDHIPRSYPNVNTSNLCVACHVGREIGDNIRSAAPFLNFSSIAFINSHYLSAGATIFKTSGFHFYTSSSKYANQSFYLHDQVGISNKNGTGNDGPCVTCHIGQDGEYKRHTFLPVDQAGTLVAKACVKCHDPALVPFSSAMSGKVIEEERAGLNAALSVLAKTLKDRGYPFNDAPPLLRHRWRREKLAQIYRRIWFRSSCVSRQHSGRSTHHGCSVQSQLAGS